MKRVFRSSITRLYVRFILSFKKEWSMSAYVSCGISINISSTEAARFFGNPILSANRSKSSLQGCNVLSYTLDGLGRIGRETWSQCRWAYFYRLHSSGLLRTNFPMASMPQIISSIPKKSFSSTFLALHSALRLAPSGNILVNTGKMRSE